MTENPRREVDVNSALSNQAELAIQETTLTQKTESIAEAEHRRIKELKEVESAQSTLRHKETMETKKSSLVAIVLIGAIAFLMLYCSLGKDQEMRKSSWELLKFIIAGAVGYYFGTKSEK